MSYKVKIVGSEKVERIGLDYAEIKEREQHLEGLSFRFIEVGRVFFSVRSR